jgi:glutathione S-transferase
MKLYYNPRSRAVIAKWMLDECGIDYEIVPIDFEKRDHKAPEFLKINPAGKLPALVDGDSRIFENAAICLYLADKFPEANLAPKIGAPERARYLSLMVYSTSQVEPAMGDALLGAKTLPQRGWTDFETVKDVIEGELGDGAYLFGHVDVLCNNAGVSTFNLIEDQTLDDWRWVFSVNLWGVVHGLHSFLPILRSQGAPAHIVNTASVAGILSGVMFIGPYAATKSAVVSISETLRQEFAFAQLPIGVSVLCPSSVDTRVMESERGRPAAFGTERRREAAEGFRLAIRESFTGPTGMTPAQVAERVLEAVRSGRFWVITHSGEKPSVEQRVAELLAEYPGG